MHPKNGKMSHDQGLGDGKRRLDRLPQFNMTLKLGGKWNVLIFQDGCGIAFLRHQFPDLFPITKLQEAFPIAGIIFWPISFSKTKPCLEIRTIGLSLNLFISYIRIIQLEKNMMYFYGNVVN